MTAQALNIDSEHGRAMLLMVVSSVLMSFGGLVIRNIEHAVPWQINFYRSAALFGVISVFMLYKFRRRVLAASVNIGALGCVAGACLGGAGMTFLQALTHTTVANTLFILGAIPFFTALFARVLLGEKLSRATQVTMVVAAAGLVVMVGEGIALGVGTGNAFALITAILFSSFAVILRGKRRTEMLPTLLVSAVVIMAVSALMQGGELSISLRDLLLSFVWGGLLSGIANQLFIYASRHLAAAEVTLFMLVEFALGPVWVYWFLGEEASRWTLIGGALIILAVAARAAMEMRRDRDARA